MELVSQSKSSLLEPDPVSTGILELVRRNFPITYLFLFETFVLGTMLKGHNDLRT